MYADYWYVGQGPWKRQEISAGLNLKKSDSFRTVQIYIDETSTDYFVPLYFDIDNEDLDISLVDAQAIYTELEKYTKDIQVYFSGAKGFHLIISEACIKEQLTAVNTKVVKFMADHIISKLNVRSFDKSVYTTKRLLRLTNSKHSRTGLYKVQLTKAQLFSTIDKIKVIAEKPCKIKESKHTLSTKLHNLYVSFLDEAKELAATTAEKKASEFSFDKDTPPVCIQHLLNNGWEVEGYRNQATIQIACFMFEAGVPLLEAQDTLAEWAAEFYPVRKEYVLDQKRRNTKSVVEYVYESPDIVFKCAGTRAIGGPDATIPCLYESCPALSLKSAGDDSEDSEYEHIDLQNLTDPVNFKKKVSTNVMVVGTRHNAFIVPITYEATCYGGEKCKSLSCGLYGSNGKTIKMNLANEVESLIEMCGITRSRLSTVLGKALHIPIKCASYKVEVTKMTDVHELIVIPKVYSESENTAYALKKVFTIKNLGILENKYYECRGVMYPNPADQTDTMVISEVKPLQKEIDEFELTEDMEAKLIEQFSCEDTYDAISNKIAEITKSLTEHVTGIYERDLELFSILLTYHSALKIEVKWDTDPIRGWIETVMIGDTGTGKSALLAKLMEFVKLGNEINAEASTRTGITYKLEQVNGSWFITWGSWVRADRELLWIDECSEIPKAEYGQMTLARSSGKLAVKRAVTAETSCRVRLVTTGNVPNGGNLSDFTRGVQSLRQIFNTEDIRRFDIGLFLRSSDISSDIYNRSSISKGTGIEPEVLRNNILFAWNIASKDILVSDSVSVKVQEVSAKLSKLFGNAVDVPLVSPSDQRNKVSRLAVSLAILLHNVNKEGQIVVTINHVEYAADFLRRIYTLPSAGLYEYSKSLSKSKALTTQQYSKAVKILNTNIPATVSAHIMDIIVRYLVPTSLINLMQVEQSTPLNRDEAKELLMQMQKMGFLLATKQGYKKTQRLNSFLELYQGNNKNFLDDILDGDDL